MTNDKLKISNKMREIRKSLKLTQTKVAKLASLDDTAIAKMENATREISALELFKLASIFKVNVNAFKRDAFFSGSFEEALVEGFSYLSKPQKQLVIETIKLAIYQKNRRAKRQQKIHLKGVKKSLNEMKLDE